VSNSLSPVEVAHSIHETNSSPSSGKVETYVPQRALELFNRYTKKDDKTVIETEGFEQLCSDANIAFDGALPLILAWQIGAKEMGKFTKDEWVKGTSTLRCVAVLFVLPQSTHDM
jgi:DCN1-like protein 4/5